MTDVEDVILALGDVIDATNEHDRSRDAYDGYSWDWHGSALIHNRDKARQRFAAALDGYIDGRIAKALEQTETVER